MLAYLQDLPDYSPRGFYDLVINYLPEEYRYCTTPMNAKLGRSVERWLEAHGFDFDAPSLEKVFVCMPEDPDVQYLVHRVLCAGPIREPTPETFLTTPNGTPMAYTIRSLQKELAKEPAWKRLGLVRMCDTGISSIFKHLCRGYQPAAHHISTTCFYQNVVATHLIAAFPQHPVGTFPHASTRNRLAKRARDAEAEAGVEVGAEVGAELSVAKRPRTL